MLAMGINNESKVIVKESYEKPAKKVSINLDLPIEISPNCLEGTIGKIQKGFREFTGGLGPQYFSVDFKDENGKSQRITHTSNPFSGPIHLPTESPIPHKVMETILKEKYGERYVSHEVQTSAFNRDKKNSPKGRFLLEGTVVIADL